MFENFNVPQELRPSDQRFGVGPSLIPNSHISALLEQAQKIVGTSHRKPAVRKLCQQIQEGLKQYFDLPAGYEVIMGNGGATFLFDMIGLGLVKKKSLHYVLGEFSSKWYKAHKLVPWLDVTKVEVDYGHGVHPQASADVDMICCTLNETSTGVQLTELPDVGTQTLLAVDATSGAGQIKIDFNKVDLYFFSPQKVFAGEGGFYFAIMSPKALARAKELEQRETYRPEVMSWKNAIENSLKNQTYNTPAISSLFLVNEQIKLMNQLGEAEVIRQAKEKLNLITKWVESKSYLDFFVKQKEFRSQSVATIDVESKYSIGDLCERLRSLEVAIDIEGYRKLNRNQLRISLFHNIHYKDLEKLLKIISLAIESEK